MFETWSAQPTDRFDADALRAWLRTVPAGVLRLKGVLRTTHPTTGAGWSEIQFCGRHGAVRHAREPQGGAAVVAIGLKGQLPAAALSQYFAGAPD